MKVKNKLRLGFGFLFVVVIAFGVAALYSINRISESAEVILKDNYKSLDYVRGMRDVIDNNTFPLKLCDVLNDGKETVNLSQFENQISCMPC